MDDDRREGRQEPQPPDAPDEPPEEPREEPRPADAPDEPPEEPREDAPDEPPEEPREDAREELPEQPREDAREELPEEPDRPLVGWAPPPGTSTAPIAGWAPPDAAAQPALDVGGVVGRTFDVFGREWSLFMVLSAPVAVVYAFQVGFVSPTEIVPVLALTVVALVAALFTVTAVIVTADAVADGRPIGVGEALRRGARAVPALVGLGLLAFLAIAALAVLGVAATAVFRGSELVAGLLVLLLFAGMIAAVFVSIRLAPVLPLIVLERIRPIPALRRTWRLTRGRMLAIFAISFVVSILTAPAVWGASLLALGTGLVAAIAIGVATLLTTSIAAIAYTLIYRELTGAAGQRAPVPDTGGAPAVPEAPPVGRGRTLGFALVLGVGAVLFLVGFGMFGSRINELATGTIPSPGTIRAGHGAGVLDPCTPADIATEFTLNEGIWLGGYFTRMVPGDGTVEISMFRDGEVIVDSVPLAAGGQAFQCYYETGPYEPELPGTYRLEVVHDGEVIATGGFTVTD